MLPVTQGSSRIPKAPVRLTRHVVVRSTRAPGDFSGISDLTGDGKSNPLASGTDFCHVCDEDGSMGGSVRGAVIEYDDPLRMPLRRRGYLQWRQGQPSNVLIVKKPGTQAASTKLSEIGTWLQDRGLEVYVEASEYSSDFRQFLPLTVDNKRLIDFCITLGGDGTVLHLATLFDADEPMPPVMSFAMGSLGFLTPFDANDFVKLLSHVLAKDDQPVFCTLRARMRCEVLVKGRPKVVHYVLNEVVMDRGSFPGTVLLELYIDRGYVTTVEADGLIIATPSGSTAYSMSVGGSLIAPSVPCTIISPVAPLRPVVVPESSSIAVVLPTYARSSARISFDGKKPMMIPKGSLMRFVSARHPLPMINLCNLDTDWYQGISEKLKWNLALRPPPKPQDSEPTLDSYAKALEDFGIYDEFTLGEEWE